MNREEYRELHRTLDFRPNTALGLLLAAAVLAGLICSVRLSISDSWLSYALGQLCLALCFHYAYLIVHECVHESFVDSKRGNMVLGFLFSIPALLPFSARKLEHHRHHTFTGNYDHDPATRRGMDAFPRRSRLKRAFLIVCWKTAFPIFAFLEHTHFWKMVFLERPKRLKQKIALLASGWVSALPVLLLLLFFPLKTILCLPAVIGYLILVEFFNLPHHFDSEFYSGAPKQLWDHHTMTKSCDIHPLIAKIVLLNFNLHTEHHFYPQLPWHRLPELSTALKKSLGDEYQSTKEIEWHLLHRGAPFQVAFQKYLAEQDNREPPKHDPH